MKSWLTTRNDSLIILGYWTVVFITLLLIKLFFVSDIFEETNFLSHDASHYQFISANGYHDYRVVFFPLFPKLWDLLNCSALVISLVNSFLYLLSLLMLVRYLRITGKDLLLIVAIPSGVFFFVPYSESIFFFCSVLLLLGIARHNWTLLLLGLFLAGISRPAFTVFLPALIILEVVRQSPVKIKVRNSLLYTACCLLSLAIVGIIQHAESGSWFTFFSEQKLWGNRLQIPVLPLESWSGVFITKLDGATLLIGLICMVYASVRVMKKLFSKEIKPIPDIVFFSILYIAGISLSVLLFRGGMLFSLNRFVFATPFIIVVIDYLLTLEVVKKKRLLLWFFFGVFAFWLLFNSFVHLQTLIKFLLLTIYLTLGLSVLISKNHRQGFIFWIFILVTFELQIYLFIRFLGNQWVG